MQPMNSIDSSGFHENAAAIIQSFDEELATRFRSSQVIRETMENRPDTQTGE